MDIDFSKSIQDWVNIFKQLFDIIANFFKALGIDFFAPETTAPATTDAGTTNA